MIELAHASWTDMRDRLSEGDTVGILPFGALEQHGPHLPLSTDTLQADAVARGIAEALDAVLLPSIEYGNTWGNAAFPGTVSLSAETVSAICRDITLALENQGYRLLVIVNGDYGNRLPIHRAAEDSAARGGMPVLVIDYPGLTDIGDDVKESPWAAPFLCHADEIETSMILHTAPELVHPDRYAPSYPELPADFGLRQYPLSGFNESGVFGDPRPATADKGRRIIEHVVGESLAVIGKTYAALGIPSRDGG